MTFEAHEESDYLGAPIEFFRISIGSSVFRYTSGDIEGNVDFDVGHTYAPLAGLKRSELRFTKEDNSQSITVTVPATSDVAQALFGKLPPTPAGIRIFVKHRTDFGIGSSTMGFSGVIASTRFKGGSCELTCSPMNEQLRLLVPTMVYQRQCPLALYGGRCGKNKEDFKTTATLTAVDGIVISADEFGDKPDGYFRAGWVELATGETQYIVGHVGNDLTLMARFPVPLEVGFEIFAFAGCDRLLPTCRDKFDNEENFFGFPFIPQRNPHSGGQVA